MLASFRQDAERQACKNHHPRLPRYFSPTETSSATAAAKMQSGPMRWTASGNRQGTGVRPAGSEVDRRLPERC
jgi:hypothetical protein